MSARGRGAISLPSAREPGKQCVRGRDAHVAGAAGSRQARRDRAVERGRARADEPCARRPRARQSSPVAVLAGGAGAARSRKSRWRCSVSKAASRPPTPRSSASRTFWATGWCGRAAPRKRADNFIAEVTALSAGDLVVHVDHGIGRFVGLRDDRGGGRAARLPGDCTTPAATSSTCRSRTSSCCRATAPRRATSISTGSAAARWQARKARMKPAHPRDRRRPDQDRGRAPVARSAEARRPSPGRMTSSAPAFPTRRPTTSRPRSTRCSAISAPAGRWTG